MDEITELIIHDDCGLPIELCKCNVVEVIYDEDTDLYCETKLSTIHGEIVLTRHAYERFLQRFKWKRNRKLNFVIFRAVILNLMNHSKVDMDSLFMLKRGVIRRTCGNWMMILKNNKLITFYGKNRGVV